VLAGGSGRGSSRGLGGLGAGGFGAAGVGGFGAAGVGDGADGGKVTPLSGQESHQIASLGRANALIVVPESQRELPEGETVDVIVLP
jgi:molybdopterin biosynthesis enzyme